MKYPLLLTIITPLLAISDLSVSAATLYVSQASPNPTPPYATWASAATNIQDAIDVASPGDEIAVTNGVYASGGHPVYGAITNRIAVTLPLSVHSVNGPAVTIILGGHSPLYPGATNGPGAIRCAYLTNGASLNGFTLANGATSTTYESSPGPQSCGGGIWCEPTNVAISNCVISGNAAYKVGGGVFRGTLYNSVIASNYVDDPYNGFAGGVHSSTLIGCSVLGNYSPLDGAGAMGSSLTNCLVKGNFAAEAGGGAALCTLMNCIVSSNSATYEGGGISDCNAYNCVFIGNSAGVGGAASSGQPLNNCTLVFNSASGQGGGVDHCALNNCIVYYNTAGNGSNNYYLYSTFANCCITPLPPGAGNFTNSPEFIDVSAGNFRLQSNSPCINSGDNAYVASSTDLDGRPRITGSVVDVGAYEFQPGVSGVFIGWLESYGLPTDGSADFADSDGDGMNNWQEWVAGTDPTNALSALRILAPTSSESGITVQWQSVSNRTYYLERSTNLNSPFASLVTNIPGQPGMTSYDDLTAVGGGPLFYRVGVQH